MQHPNIRNIFLFLSLLGLATLLPPTAHADSAFTVDTVADLPDNDTSDGACHTSANTCSLRAAIMQANHVSGPAVTVINVPAGTYLLTRPRSGSNGEDDGDLNLTSPSTPGQIIVIAGAGAASTIVDANQLDRAIHVGSGRTAYIDDITIRNGSLPSGPNSLGSGILNDGTLWINRCVIEGNYGANGSGGGIYNSEFAVLEVVGSTIRSNLGAYGGGMGLHGVTTIRDSTVYGNGSGLGGAIYVWSGYIAYPTLLYVINSTLSNNWANVNGGGIHALNLGDANNSRVFLYNTSVIGNDADHDHDQIGGTGGGVYVTPGARFVVFNTLIAGNTQMDGNAADDCSGTLETHSFNLLDDLMGCTFTGNGNFGRGLVSLNTIGPLQDNGGPTLTHALLAGSQAINATNNLGCVDEANAPLTTDQRGARRRSGLNCDVGAFEYGAAAPGDLIFENDFD